MTTPNDKSDDMQQGGKAIYPLTGELSIYEALGMKAQLLEALASCEDLTIDLAGVTLLDSAGLQLLIMLKREALRQGKRMALAAHSEAVLKVLDLANLASYFGDPLVLPAEQTH